MYLLINDGNRDDAIAIPDPLALLLKSAVERNVTPVSLTRIVEWGLNLIDSLPEEVQQAVDDETIDSLTKMTELGFEVMASYAKVFDLAEEGIETESSDEQ